jgi:hypothetical protein
MARWYLTQPLSLVCNEEYRDYADYWDGSPIAVDCFDTHNNDSPIFTDTSDQNVANRQWMWLSCNEPFFYWQT